jgi:hypothetical protein
MKKNLFLLLLPILCFCFSGCWIYGDGASVGYVTTVEDGVFWNSVWFRADLESSNTDAYAIRKNNYELKKQLLETSRNKQRIEILYKKHVSMARMGGKGDEVRSDEIVGFKII